ncbi:MAG TPA: sigma-70 family RNA polymerase sigma factor [Myxococcota bacterium]|nr:sigma-70 family RNA polymerase sigma factor [Myxococcota bacterium]
MGDLELLRDCAGGARAACAEIVRRHQAAVWRACVALTRDEVEAEEVFQETFLAALRGAGGFSGERARPWLLTIARHAQARLHRRRAGEPAVVEPLEEMAVAAGFGSPEAEVARHEESARLDAALRRLSVEDREVIVLRDIEGLEGREVAEALGLGVPAMKTRLHRARLRLMAALRAEVGDGR